MPFNIINDTYVLELPDLKMNHNFYEKYLEQGLIDKLQEFLLELGKCFLLVDLKAGKRTHQDIGQMDFYVRYFEEQVRPENDNPSIG